MPRILGKEQSFGVWFQKLKTKNQLMKLKVPEQLLSYYFILTTMIISCESMQPVFVYSKYHHTFFYFNT